MRESGLGGCVKRSEAKLTHMHHDPGPRGWWMPWGASIFERETEHASFCYVVPAADRWPLSARLHPLLEVATLRLVHTLAPDLHVHNRAIHKLGLQPHRRATEANQILPALKRVRLEGLLM